MKRFSVALMAVLCCAVVVYAGVDTDGMRESIKCGDDVFANLAKEHKELEKYHDEYKTLADGANSQLDGCEKEEDSESEEECIDNVVLRFSMEKFAELLSRLQAENQELANKLEESIDHNCI